MRELPRFDSLSHFSHFSRPHHIRGEHKRVNHERILTCTSLSQRSIYGARASNIIRVKQQRGHRDSLGFVPELTTLSSQVRVIPFNPAFKFGQSTNIGSEPEDTPSLTLLAQ